MIEHLQSATHKTWHWDTDNLAKNKQVKEQIKNAVMNCFNCYEEKTIQNMDIDSNYGTFCQMARLS